METRRGRTIAAILTILLVVEYLPAAIPTSSPEIPAYVFALRDRADRDGVLDLVADQSLRLWYQTIHRKPLAFGYLARLPQSVARRDRQLQDVVESGRVDRLWPDYRLRYVVANGAIVGALNRAGAAKVWEDGTAGVFDVTAVSPAP